MREQSTGRGNGGTRAPSPRAGAQQPAYQVLAQHLRDAILSGRFPPNRQLPTEAELATEHGVSRQTVRQAYGQLVAESLVYRVRGRGSFATPFPSEGPYIRSFGSVDEALSDAFDTELEVVEPLERRTDLEAASRLQLRSDELMVATYRRMHDSATFCLTTTYLPVNIGTAIARAGYLATVGSKTKENVVGLVEREANVSIAGCHQSITAVAATAYVGEQLAVETGTALLRIDRLYYGRDGARVELAVNYCNPLRYSYRLELRRSVR